MELIALKEMDLPFVLDYTEQTIAKLSKDQLENPVEEFSFYIKYRAKTTEPKP